MLLICQGQKTKAEMVHETLEQYRAVYVHSQRRLDSLQAVSQAFSFHACGVSSGRRRLTCVLWTGCA